jgi:hypothetical protein
MVDLDECIARVMRLELLGEDLVRDLCERLRHVLVSESNVQHIAAPVTVVGDVHGYAVCMSPPTPLARLTRARDARAQAVSRRPGAVQCRRAVSRHQLPLPRSVSAVCALVVRA